ncbi:MAG: DUF2079 domain-containing protein, partial [Candidatus Bathyarchaeia archaeon]
MLEQYRLRLYGVKPKHIVWMLIIGYTIFFSSYTIMKHCTFQTGAGDLGFFEQAFWSTAHGRPLYISLWDDLGTSTLAHHFQPIILLLMPVYCIYQNPETLLVLQSFFLALGALPVYWICTKKFKEYIGVSFAASYLMYPALQGINQFDFHVSALAVPFLLFAFHYIEEKQYATSALFSALALMCKEDVALTLGMLALYVMYTNRSEIRASKQHSHAFLFGLSLIIVATVWFFVCVYLIVPSFNTAGVYLHFGKFFPSLTGCELPFNELAFAIDQKLLFSCLLMGPSLFLPLLSPSTFLITIPTWTIIFLSQHTPAYQIGYQYPYTIIPFAFVSAIYGLKRLKFNETFLKKFTTLLVVVGFVFMLFVS